MLTFQCFLVTSARAKKFPDGLYTATSQRPVETLYSWKYLAKIFGDLFIKQLIVKTCKLLIWETFLLSDKAAFNADRYVEITIQETSSKSFVQHKVLLMCYNNLMLWMLTSSTVFRFRVT